MRAALGCGLREGRIGQDALEVAAVGAANDGVLLGEIYCVAAVT